MIRTAAAYITVCVSFAVTLFVMTHDQIEKQKDALAECIDLLELEYQAGAICVDVLDSCVKDLGDLAEAHEILFGPQDEPSKDNTLREDKYAGWCGQN